jgi:hypothetical protein
MHFDTKSYLKSTCNHTAKHALNIITPIQNQFKCYKDEIKENKGKEKVIKKRKKRKREGEESAPAYEQKSKGNAKAESFLIACLALRLNLRLIKFLNFFFAKIECGLHLLDRFDVLMSKIIFKK